LTKPADYPLISGLKKQIDELSVQLPNTPATARATDENLLLRRQNLLQQLDEARLIFKDHHPRIQNLKKQIDELTAQLPKTPQSGEGLSKVSGTRQMQMVLLIDTPLNKV
jgi:uncharacterized coiled-coil DUF342 family protein